VEEVENMEVSIKALEVNMPVSKQGLELEIGEPNSAKKLGNLVVTKTHLIWSEGRTRRENGKKVKWSDFIKFVNDAQAPAPKVAAKKRAAKKVAAKKAPVKRAKKVAVTTAAFATTPEA
jgi:hypothetical protein